MSIAEIIKGADTKMHKSVEALRADFTKIRTGRAHTGLLDHIQVHKYFMGLEQNRDVPIGEVVAYVERGEGDLPDLGARALGLIGREEGFLPILGRLRASAELKPSPAVVAA